MLSETQGFFAGLYLPRMLLAVSVRAVLKLLITVVFAKDVVGCFCQGSVKAVDLGVYFSVLSFKGADWKNFSFLFARKISAMLGSLSFSRLNLILMLFCFFALWRRSLRVIITSSWSLPISAPGRLLVFAMFTLAWKHRLTMT